MNRIVAAIKALFSLFFTGVLPDDVARAYGYVKKSEAKAAAAAPAPPPAQLTPEDGALQILGILQRDGRLVDFLMEDISGASDDQVGAAVRTLQEQCRASLERYVRLSPVIDGVEGSYTKIETSDPVVVKLLGNVPVNGKASGGLLRHRGWRAEKVDLPVLKPSQKSAVIAPAEIEIE